MNLFVPILTLFLLAPDSDVKAQEWKKFVPLNTTRAEVEAILGPAGEGFEVTYQLKDGSLSIEYSTGPCRSDRKGGWNVPKDVIISLLFSPKHPKKLSALKLDLTKYRKVAGGDTPSVTYYINDEDGIVYSIQMGKVDYVEYSPPKKYDHLRCKDQPIY